MSSRPVTLNPVRVKYILDMITKQFWGQNCNSGYTQGQPEEATSDNLECGELLYVVGTLQVAGFIS